MSMFLNALCSLNTFAPSRFWGFVRKKHRNAHGFAREFLRYTLPTWSKSQNTQQAL